MKNLIALLIIVLAFYSCNSELTDEQKAEQKEAQEQKAAEQYLMKKNIFIHSLNLKYSIKYKWDSLGSFFDIDYMPVINSKYQLIGHFVLNNIYIKDCVEYISIRTGYGKHHDSGYSPFFYFDFPITKEQETIFQQNNDQQNNDLILVVSIEKIRKLKFVIVGEENSEDPTAILENSKDFIGTGKIIEIKKIPTK